MRVIVNKLTLLSAALMMLAVPAFANDGAMDKTLDRGQTEKNECLLVAMNCGNQVDSIQQRIERIKKEISRGTDVYTNDELRRLNRQLDDAVKTLENETAGS